MKYIDIINKLIKWGKTHICGGQNTFPEHAYESIDNVIKE